MSIHPPSRSTIVLSAAAAALLAACLPVPVGGPCRYETTQGSCLVLSVAPAPAGEPACGVEAVTIRYAFVAAGSAAAGPGDLDLLVGGRHPPAAWAQAQGLTPGATVPCEGSRQVSGACVPFTVRFLALDLAAAGPACR